MKLHRNNDRFCEGKAPTDADLRAQLRAEQAEEQAEALREEWNAWCEACHEVNVRESIPTLSAEEALAGVLADSWNSALLYTLKSFYEKEFDKWKHRNDSLGQ